VAWSLLIALRQVYSEHWEQNKKKKEEEISEKISVWPEKLM
jgi:hypothetical protein